MSWWHRTPLYLWYQEMKESQVTLVVSKQSSTSLVKSVVAAYRKIPMCDACHVAVAQWEIRLPSGYLYFCGHHKAKHMRHISAQSYAVRELVQS